MTALRGTVFLRVTRPQTARARLPSAHSAAWVAGAGSISRGAMFSNSRNKSSPSCGARCATTKAACRMASGRPAPPTIPARGSSGHSVRYALPARYKLRIPAALTYGFPHTAPNSKPLPVSFRSPERQRSGLLPRSPAPAASVYSPGAVAPFLTFGRGQSGGDLRCDHAAEPSYGSPGAEGSTPRPLLGATTRSRPALPSVAGNSGGSAGCDFGIVNILLLHKSLAVHEIKAMPVWGILLRHSAGNRCGAKI